MDLVPVNEVNNIDEQVDVEFFNKENKKSVYNLMPKRWERVLERVGIKEELEKEEWELKKAVKVTPTLNRLRYSFWNEYYRSVDMNKQMVERTIYAGVCAKEVYERIIRNNANLAWILCPPTDTVVALRETLNYGLDRIREILDLPLHKIESVKVGKDEFEDREVVDEKVANLMLKAVAMVDLRLHGSYVQVSKIEQKTLNVNKNVTNVENNYKEPTPVMDIDAQLLELRDQVKDDVKKLEAPFNHAHVKEMDRNGINVRELTNVSDAVLVQAKVVGEVDTDVEDL